MWAAASSKHSSTWQGAMYKLEGSMVGQLQNGQYVTMMGTWAPTGGPAAGGASRSIPERLQVSSIILRDGPAHPSEALYLHSSPSASPGAGGSSNGQQVLHHSKERVPTLKPPRRAGAISTLVLPLSFEGCPHAFGGTYERPWWNKRVI